MIFYLALTIMVIYTLFFFYTDLSDYLNKGGTFGEAMTNPLPNKGKDYRGTLNKTKSGRTCQNWTSQSPHKHNNTPQKKPNRGVGNHNYCRNPTNHTNLWCYTTDKDKRWDDCDASIDTTQISQGISNAQQQGNKALNDLLEQRPNLKQAIDSGKPDFMKGLTSAMPHLMSAYTKSKPELDKAKPYLEKAYKKAEPDIKLAQPHLKNAIDKAKPDFKKAFDNSFNDFNEAYQKSRPYLGTEVMEMGQTIRGESSPTSVTENVMAHGKNNGISQATQSAETPLPTQEFSVNDASFSRLSNGLISRPGKGVCPNGCLAPQYDNDMCANEIFMGKSYRSCPWVTDGRIDNSACKDCGSILIPKNRYGYARTRPGLFNEKSLKIALEACKLNKESDNLDYAQIGMDFMDDLSRIKQFREPRLKESEYSTIGRIVYKYDMDKLNTSLYKNRLTRVLNNVLNSTDLQQPMLEHKRKYRRNRKCGEREKSNPKVAQLKSMMGDLKYQGSVDGAIDEMRSDNRLGGSKTSYRKNYKPVDPNKFPRPYDAIWTH
tara:strand:- start:17 stop:1651 length:1635 start_codon:yes stop_codon:yes gene_type:complete